MIVLNYMYHWIWPNSVREKWRNYTEVAHVSSPTWESQQKTYKRFDYKSLAGLKIMIKYLVPSSANHFALHGT